jgi:hypothetical protein
MEGKKSFVLYSDQREIFEQLTDEQAGKLIKHIYSYVNDENPSSNDPFVNIPFTLIKLQLKRDLKKWEIQQEQRKLAGKKSAEIRKQALTESNERSISSTVNDNVNVNDNVTVIKKKNEFQEFQADANKDLEAYQTYIHETLKGKQISIDTLLKNTGIYPEWKEELYIAFLKNAIEEVPQITDEKHAYNTFKLFVRNNAKNYNKPKSKIKDNWW